MLIDRTKEIIQRIRRDSRCISDDEFYARELQEWMHSPHRLHQICGCNYYLGKQDILLKKRSAIGEGGERIIVDNLPNNRVIDNQYAKVVDQKVNYLLGKPLTLQSEDKVYLEEVSKILNKKFMRLMKNTLRYTLNCGIAWIYPYYNQGKLSFKLFPGYEVLPFWADNEHTELDCAIRTYFVIEYEGKSKVIKQKAELYKKEGVYLYVLEGGKLIPDLKIGEESNFKPYIKGGKTWKNIPLIAFKNGSEELPLINRVKSLQDGLNVLLSNFQDCMEENIRNTILVIKNYDGEDLGEFRRNLTTYGAVKVRTVDGSQGGVETLGIEVNSDNYKVILELFKKAIIENAMSFDAKDDRLSGNPNQMNIMSMYSDIDLDANEIETEYQAAFEELFEFIDTYIGKKGSVDVIFNRDILINESEAIDNCIKSLSLLSDESVIARHPWVNDVEKELRRRENEESDGYTLREGEVDAEQ